ncbi:MAG: hypothetical protein P1U87_20500 [Verrucomicrobiales bacterium]|nr:hypothetical protein [Verrucomicrobiales bacterium]
MQFTALFSLSLFLASAVSSVRADDSVILADYAGSYTGEFVGTFEGSGATTSGRVRLPRASNRKVTVSVTIRGEEQNVSGRITSIRCRPKRVTYRGIARVSYLGVSASGMLRGTARQKKGFKTLRIPIYLSKEIFGERFTLTGRFLGRK